MIMQEGEFFGNKGNKRWEDKSGLIFCNVYGDGDGNSNDNNSNIIPCSFYERDGTMMAVIIYFLFYIR
jgi:hypothetical protein